MVWVMGLMFLVMYFLMIRPQQKQEKALKAMRGELKRGDKVVTASGMHGTVTEISDSTVTLRTDQDGRTKMTFDLSAIGRVVKGDEGAGKTG
jgi:preprotein translocase subunit YajC